MKLFSSYNHTFNIGTTPDIDIWKIVKDIPSLNGIYVALPEYVTESNIGTTIGTTKYVYTWYNLLGDTNYLYAISDNKRPILNIQDSQFNNNPSVNFLDNGNTYLKLKFPVSVGTVVMVYNIQVSGGYIIYAPRVDLVEYQVYSHYDAFPSGGINLWSNEPKLNGSVYNATSRINGKVVSSNVFVPLNNTRILTIKNIANADKKESILGFGGQTGAIGGVNKSSGIASNSNSFKGKLAAVITFENDIDEEDLIKLEAKLAEIYIDYKGSTVNNYPIFRYLVGDNFNFDFSTIVVDEWYDIENYELDYPLDIGISFTDSILSGYLLDTYKGKIGIKITNSANITNRFEFDLEVVKSDPIVDNLPNKDNISLILSSDYDNEDSYGIYAEGNKVIKWEDARRLNKPVYEAIGSKEPIYINSDIRFNSKPVVTFTDNSELVGTSVNAKTFIWVYEQTSYGTRNMLNTFPDIKGEGQLWTVPNNNSLHGDTAITQLVTTVNRLQVATISYILKLNSLYIIVATQPEDTSVAFNGIKNMRGKLAMFISWDVVLNNTEISDVVTLLTEKYFSDLSPLVVDDSTEYKTVSNITIDLSKKVLDMRGQQLTYNILVNPNSAYILDDNLNLTSITDETLYYEIECTNEDNLSTLLKFYVDVTLRTNPLYLAIKSILGTSVELCLLPEPDTLTLEDTTVTAIEDYRLNGIEYISNGNIKIASLVQTDNKIALDFNINGSDYLSGDSISGKAFIFVYIKKNNSTGRFFLLGQDESLDFSSGTDNFIFDSNITAASILNSDNYVNSRLIDTNYKIKNNVLNIIVLNSTTDLSFSRIAKDRVFTDRSVKGYLALIIVSSRTVTAKEQLLLNKSIRDYYDSPRYVTLLHLNNNLIDNSTLNKQVTSSATFSSVHKKFGSHSLQLVSTSIAKTVTIPNLTSYAFLNEDFTISFWLALNTVTTSTESIVIYRQTDLILYISNYTLYVGNTTIKDLSYMSYTLNSNLISNLYNFFNIEITKASNILRLFVNGVLVGQYTHEIEMRDDNTDIILGQNNNIISIANLNMYIDEFMVYRRLALHTEDFTVATSEYN